MTLLKKYHLGDGFEDQGLLKNIRVVIKSSVVVSSKDVTIAEVGLLGGFFRTTVLLI